MSIDEKITDQVRHPDLSTRDRAALRLFDLPDVARHLRRPEIAEAVLAGVAQGSPSAAAVLLLSYLAPAKAGPVLRRVRDGAEGLRTKLHPWDMPVALALVVDLGLSRLGDQPARHRLLERLETADAAEWSFLLAALREVDDATLLRGLARSLDDQRRTGGGVPSGAAPERRLCDVAVDAFVARLALQPGFDPRPAGRYTAAEVEQVKRQVAASIPT